MKKKTELVERPTIRMRDIKNDFASTTSIKKPDPYIYENPFNDDGSTKSKFLPNPAEDKTYSEKLKHPKWQRKRLEIMQRDGFKCVFCKDEETTLHVHHKTYLNGKNPWEYEDHNFITLCEKCHNSIHDTGNPKITEEKGVLSVLEFIATNGEYKRAFSEIGNHEGMWTVCFHKNLNIIDIMISTHKLKEYIKCVDNMIYAKGHDDINLFDIDYVYLATQVNTFSTVL